MSTITRGGRTASRRLKPISARRVFAAIRNPPLRARVALVAAAWAVPGALLGAACGLFVPIPVATFLGAVGGAILFAVDGAFLEAREE